MPALLRCMILFCICNLLTACGGGGESSSPSPTPPATPPANIAPSIGLSDTQVQALTTVSLSAQATDSDGSIASYQWIQKSGESIVIENATTSTITFETPNPSSDTDIIFTLTITDDDGAGTSKDITVTIIANKAPTIALDNMQLEASGVTEISAQAQDSDGSITSYQWSQISGPDLALPEANKETLIFTPPAIIQETDVVILLTVTDDDGATASKEITFTFIPNTQKFTLSGKVFTNNFIFKNSPVTATIGNKSFSTITNELGQFSIEVGSLSNSLLDQMVIISATGTASNSVIKLVSYVNDLNTLVEQAELNNGTVTNSELSRLNITSISSAAAALIERDNGEVPPATKQDYLSLERNFSSEHLMLTALLIDNVIDKVSTQSSIPASVNNSNFTNIYDFIINANNALALYYDISPSNDDIDTFSEVIDNNSEMVSSLANFTDTQSQRIFYSWIGKLTLNENGGGELLSELAGKQSITWQQTDDALSISLSESMLLNSQSRDTAEYGFTLVDQYLDGYHINISFNGIHRDELLVTPLYSYQATDYDNAIVTAYVDINVNRYRSYEQATAVDLSKTIATTSKFVVDFLHPNAAKFINYQNELTASDFKSFTLSFNSDTQVSLEIDTTNETTGEISKELINASWSFKNKAIEITNEEWLITITGLSRFNNVQTQTLVTAQNTQDEKVSYTSFHGSMYEQLSPVHTWTNNNVAGVYQYFTLQAEINPLATYWYELRSDGTLSYFSIYSSSNSSPIKEVDQNNIIESPGLWRIVDNKLVIRRYRYNFAVVDNYERCHSEAWDTNNNSKCILYFQREWQLHSKFNEDNQPRELIQQRTQYYYDYQRSRLDEQNMPEGSLLYVVSSINSHFKKRETRPVNLPDDYILIKDRAENSTPIPLAHHGKILDESLR